MDGIDPNNPDRVSDAFINAIICPTTGKKQEFEQLMADPQMCHTWNNGMYDELGRLAQGNKNSTTSKAQTWCISFIQLLFPKTKWWHTSELK